MRKKIEFFTLGVEEVREKISGLCETHVGHAKKSQTVPPATDSPTPELRESPLIHREN